MKNRFNKKTEGQVKNEILKSLRKNFPSGVWYKIHGSLYQERGLPDILGCYKSVFYGIEIKAPGKENNVTEYQAYQIKRIREAGGISGVTSSAKTVVEIIKKNF